MTIDYLKHIKILLVTCLILVTMMAFFPYGQSAAADGKEAKITSSGGYTGLISKSQIKGTVKIIVRARAPFIPESLLQETDKNAQRASRLHIQDQIITELESKGHKPRRIHKYKYSPYISMTVDSATLDALLASPDIISIEEDIPVPPALDLSVPRIGAAALHESNVTGAGVAVAILDTGVDKTHPFLLGSVISEACYSTNGSGSIALCPGGEEESTDVGSALPCGGSYPTSDCDHGTHVAGIVAGRRDVAENLSGVAPEAGIIAIQVFSRFDSYEDCGSSAPCLGSWSSDQMKGLEKIYELRSAFPIASVNMSLGGEGYPDNCDINYPAMKEAIDLLRTAGISTVIASGNNGYCGAISTPACISSAISVGATDDISDAVTGFSNSASFLSLLAPGQWITSSVPGGGYESWRGTSMAAPHVAGAWALMKQEHPGATVDDILDALTSTGLSVTDQGCTSVTKQRIDVEEAYNYLSNNAKLIVAKRGVGTGTVISDLLGIRCGDVCNFWFPRDTTVTLNASADHGSAFGGWIGGGCSGTGECTVTLSASTSVTALFLKQVTIGTEISITGFDFGSKKGKVLIGDVATKIAKDGWTGNTITVAVTKVPTGSPGIFNLTVMPKGTDSSLIQDTIEVKKPEVADLGYHGASGYPILINGRFFGTKKPKIYLEYIDKNGQTKKGNCKVTDWSMDTTTGESRLEFIVPKGLESRAYPLKVFNKVGTSGPVLFTID